MTKEFVIATDVSDLSPLELQLFNLKWRLRLQLDMVERTKRDIDIIEELIETEKNQEKKYERSDKE